MKKLLVLMLVLGIASMANATLFLYQNGAAVGGSTITMAPGATITLQVYSTDTSNYNAYVINGDDSAVADLIGVLGNPIVLSAAGDMSSKSPYTDGGGWGNGELFGTAGSPASGTVHVGVQHTIDFVAAGAGETIVHLYDGTSYEGLDMVTIIVPEPATIALLCLGGLLLRKKK